VENSQAQCNLRAGAGFAPLIRDQGASKIATGEVGTAVVRGMLLACDTEK
jgi:hypothetical protein